MSSLRRHLLNRQRGRGGRVLSGCRATRASAWEGQFSFGELEAQCGLDLATQSGHGVIVEVADGAAGITDDMVVHVVGRELVVAACEAKVGSEQEALFHECVKGAVDRGAVEIVTSSSYGCGDFCGGLVSLSGFNEGVPDQGALSGDPSAA